MSAAEDASAPATFEQADALVRRLAHDTEAMQAQLADPARRARLGADYEAWRHRTLRALAGARHTLREAKARRTALAAAERGQSDWVLLLAAERALLALRDGGVAIGPDGERVLAAVAARIPAAYRAARGGA